MGRAERGGDTDGRLLMWVLGDKTGLPTFGLIPLLLLRGGAIDGRLLPLLQGGGITDGKQLLLLVRGDMSGLATAGMLPLPLLLRRRWGATDDGLLLLLLLLRRRRRRWGAGDPLLLFRLGRARHPMGGRLYSSYRWGPMRVHNVVLLRNRQVPPGEVGAIRGKPASHGKSRC